MGGKSSKYLRATLLGVKKCILGPGLPVSGDLDQTGLLAAHQGAHPSFGLSLIVNLGPKVLVPEIVRLRTRSNEAAL